MASSGGRKYLVPLLAISLKGLPGGIVFTLVTGQRRGCKAVYECCETPIADDNVPETL